MALESHMLYAQTHQISEAAEKAVKCVKKLNSKIASLESENKSLKKMNASAQRKIVELQSSQSSTWITDTPPLDKEILLETSVGFWRVTFHEQERIDFLVNEGEIKRWIPFPKTSE